MTKKVAAIIAYDVISFLIIIIPVIFKVTGVIELSWILSFTPAIVFVIIDIIVAVIIRNR